MKNSKPEKFDEKNISRGGYTLIEVVIALTITSIAFVAIYALFAKSMQSDAESRYEIVAAALSQEGIEMIKNKRENNEMKWAMWKSSDSAKPLTSFEGIDSLSGCNPGLDLGTSFFSCDSGGSISMQYNRSVSYKKYVANCSGADCVGPIFERRCTATTVNLNAIGEIETLRVVCIVEWKSLLLGGEKRSAKTEVVLTDWQR